MTKEAAEILMLCGFYDVELHADYSGRGMFGETTYAISSSEADFFKILAEIMEDETYSKEERRKVAEALRNLRTDNLGTDVIYY